jgi:uncharacterized protein (DUF433 family)
MALLDTFIAEPPPLRLDEDGAVRVASTRVTLDTVIEAYYNGCEPEEIGLKYPVLGVMDIYAVIAHYLRHREEVDAYLEERRGKATGIREAMEARFPSRGLRERLLARRDAKQ